MTTEEIIDREKRERENRLAEFLLLLTKRARNHAYAAVKVGADPYQAIADVFYGNAGLGIPSPAPMLAGHLVACVRAGYHRTEIILSPPLALDATPRPVKGGPWLYRAGQWVGRMLATIQRRVGQAFGSGTRGAPAVRQAFVGYTEQKPHAVENAAANMVASAYSEGYAAGWQRPEAVQAVKGFRFSATMDQATTQTCRECNGVEVPAGDPWLLTHTPPLHFNCRSVLVPIFRAFEATNPLPSIQPMAGFGRSSGLFGRAA